MKQHRPRLPFAAIAGTLVATAAVSAVLQVTPAEAHGFASTVYVKVTAPAHDRVRTEIDLEYDLLVASAADTENDPDFYAVGMDLFETGDEQDALDAHADTVKKYVTERFTVTADGEPCVPSQVGGLSVHERDGVPYALLVLDHSCSAVSAAEDGVAHELRSALFPDAENYVSDTKTIATYDLDGRSGSAALDAAHPSFSTGKSWTERFGEFFLLGAEHLLGGLDHLLFLLALIVGSRRLRDVVLAATTFTVAHSVTFLLAALGLVAVPSAVVEPLIALSIAVVAAGYLWRLWRRPANATALQPGRGGRLSLDRTDWTRLAVVFFFGLVHGLGFAGALGIDEAWSWVLLWSLIVFNGGIEVVQLGIIAVAFPLLALLGSRAPRVGLWTGAVVAAGVTAMGLIWFVERGLGLG
ncbi:HupE/UreJ family protein [Arthrobacter sp. NPDC056886]|uniref:HupE/UreJ family protein n=1 Tax=Arthrobacter sp. NPDC056886 TaxID=3345960 RepID=UPI00366E49AE